MIHVILNSCWLKKSHGMGEFICSVFTVKCGKQMKVNIESEMGMTKQFAIECQ